MSQSQEQVSKGEAARAGAARRRRRDAAESDVEAAEPADLTAERDAADEAADATVSAIDDALSDWADLLHRAELAGLI